MERTFRNRWSLWTCVFACCAMSVLGGVRAYNTKTASPDKALDHFFKTPALGSTTAKPVTLSEMHSRPARISPQAPTKPKLTDSVLITITPGGFNATEITSPPIPFFLLIENRSGLSELSLRLDRLAGNRLRQVSVGREQPDWSDLLDLTPGSYVLSEANHSDWNCRITITPH
jgi:hypothetical protein